MTKVDLENKVENLMAKKEELLNNKEIFKVNMDKIFSDFKNISFIPYFENIRSEVNNKFNDYIANAETKLSKYQASKYLDVSRATFDNWVKDGKLPEGRKEQGFKEKFWIKSDLDKIKLENSN